MNSKFASLLFLLMSSSLVHAAELKYTVPKYKAVEGWLKPGAEVQTLGAAHGDVAVSEAGDVYVSILNGPRGGIQVFSADGNYLRNLPSAPNDFHGFVIHKEKDGEFIYGARLQGQTILKMKLDGAVVMEIDGSVIPSEYRTLVKEKPTLRLTAVDVAPDGRIFVTDGYGTDYIHVFDADGKYLKSFGGKTAPYGFKTCHKIAIDTRFDPPRIFCCDRENRRAVHLSLDGEVLGVIPDLKRPAAVAIYGDWAAVCEIEGRLSLIDKNGQTVATLGENTVAEQTATNKVAPADWRTGVLTAPHGVDFDRDGDILVSEFNMYGRVLRWDRDGK
jgi:hypothetical protein